MFIFLQWCNLQMTAAYFLFLAISDRSGKEVVVSKRLSNTLVVQINDLYKRRSVFSSVGGETSL